MSVPHSGHRAAGLRQETIDGWLEVLPGPAKSIQLPLQHEPPLSLLIDASEASAASVAVTYASYRRGTVQGLPVQIFGLPEESAPALREWLSQEPYTSFPDDLSGVVCAAAALLVVPAGTLFSTYSVEAAHDLLRESAGSAVLRVVVDGAPGAAELWKTCELRPDPTGAEERARREGRERWVSGASLGIYYQGMPQPKPHLRKGVAGTLDLVIVAQDGALPEVREEYLDRIKSLESQVQRLKRAQWQQALKINARNTGAPASIIGLRSTMKRIIRLVSAGRR